MVEAAKERTTAPIHAFVPLREGAIPGLVLAFRFRADGNSEELAADQPIDPAALAPGEWLWLHLNLADKRATNWIGAKAEVPPAARVLLVAAHDHQQLYATGECVFGVFSDLTRTLDRDLDRVGYLTFAMTARLLVTGRRQSLQAVEAVRLALAGGRRIANPAALIEATVEQVTLGIDRLLGDLARELDAIEDLVLIDAVADERRRVGHVRRTGVHLHRQLAGLRSLLNRFEVSDEIALSPAIELNTDRLVQRLDDLDQEVRAIQERARLLQDEIGSRLSEESTRHLNALSILTALLLPATLVTGIFGMNTSDLPFTSTAHGSFWAILLGVAVAALAYWLLRRMGVIKRGPRGRQP